MPQPLFECSQQLKLKHPKQNREIKGIIVGREIGVQNKRQHLLNLDESEPSKNKAGWLYIIQTDENERFILSEEQLSKIVHDLQPE